MHLKLISLLIFMFTTIGNAKASLFVHAFKSIGIEALGERLESVESVQIADQQDCSESKTHPLNFQNSFVWLIQTPYHGNFSLDKLTFYFGSRLSI